MSQTKLVLKIGAILLVLLGVGMQLQFVMIPALRMYKFWMVVISFVLLLIADG